MAKKILSTLTALLIVSVGFAGCASKSHRKALRWEEDPFLWLEDIDSPKALEWVRSKNAGTISELETDPSYRETEAELRKIIFTKDRIPAPTLIGKWVYNFWQDDDHVHGIWRRTSIEDYIAGKDRWKTILDLDLVSQSENENWVYQSESCLPPRFRRCMVMLSRGGKDARVAREFDTEAGRFVKGGFELPEAHSFVGWLSENELLVATNWGSATVASTKYPRIIKLWKRGSPLETAEKIFEGDPKSLSTKPEIYWDSKDRLVVLREAKSYFNHVRFAWTRQNGVGSKVELPEDASLHSLFERHLIFSLRSDWTHGERTYRAGSVLATPLTTLPQVKPALIYEPGERSSFRKVAATKTALYIETLEKVSGKVYRATREGDTWTTRPIELPANGSVSLAASSPDRSELFLEFESFLVPTTLYALSDSRPPKMVRARPPAFDASSFITEQFEATSKDGTRVPYFITYRKAMALDASHPTLIFAYGGFNNSTTPSYSGPIGKAWLEKGGVYVVANIRGGGEFGPEWHRAALKKNRQRSFDDFIAVAEDLVARKVTSPRHLGIMGHSNGGLLVATVMVQRPDLFGAVVSEVPLTDMSRYSKLLSGRFWMDEYGDPDDVDMAPVLRAYSPYHGLKPTVKYPRPFFLTSTKDDRVHPAHARKMTAKMESLHLPALYFENVEGGHATSANLEEQIRLLSLKYTYLLRELK